MVRPDVSNKLIHLTKGENDAEACVNLIKILKERTLRGGDGFIKGKYNCVCFCETPISHLALVLTNREKLRFKYRAFGLMFSKSFVFEKGGRPAIYGDEEQFEQLPEAMRYRHVLFNPTAKPPVDLTWEREWRLKTDEFKFSPADVTIVVPNRVFVERAYEKFPELLPKVGEEPSMPWHFTVLEDIGVEIPLDLGG